MSDLDLLRVASSLSLTRCTHAEMAANHEVNWRFERLRERFLVLHEAMDNLRDKHHALEARFDTLATALQRALMLLAEREVMPGDSAAQGETDPAAPEHRLGGR
jgi:imidazoleglycerol phosphate dehydratase HisB